MDLKEEAILKDTIANHWYYVSKGRALQSFLGDIRAHEVLDIGAGSGVFARQMLDKGRCNSAVCVDPYYTEEKIEWYRGKQIQFVKCLKNHSAKLLLMMDVLEHVTDDLAFMKEYVRHMEKGGYALITVPAFQFLWSGHDVFLEHYRRYTIKTMEELIVQSGLTPIKSRYFFGCLFPIVAGIRMIKGILSGCGALKAQSELKTYPEWLNRILITVHDLERQSLFGSNKLFGLSVFCLCRKD